MANDREEVTIGEGDVGTIEDVLPENDPLLATGPEPEDVGLTEETDPEPEQESAPVYEAPEGADPRVKLGKKAQERAAAARESGDE